MSTPITRQTLRSLTNKVLTYEEMRARALQYIVDPIYKNVVYNAACGHTVQKFYPNLTYHIDHTPITTKISTVMRELERLFPDCEILYLPLKDDAEDNAVPTGFQISW